MGEDSASVALCIRRTVRKCVVRKCVVRKCVVSKCVVRKCVVRKWHDAMMQ